METLIPPLYDLLLHLTIFTIATNFNLKIFSLDSTRIQKSHNQMTDIY